MKVLREWVGGAEEIDLDTDEGWRHFAFDVTQDEQVAEEMRDIIFTTGDMTINDDQPEYFERYTRLEDDD